MTKAQHTGNSKVDMARRAITAALWGSICPCIKSHLGQITSSHSPFRMCRLVILSSQRLSLFVLSAEQGLEMATGIKGSVPEGLMSRLTDGELRRHGQSQVMVILNLSSSFRGHYQPLPGQIA